MFITHSKKAKDQTKKRGIHLAQQYKLNYHPRTKASLESMMDEYGQNAFVVGNAFDELYYQGEDGISKHRFHPSSAKLRIQQIQQGQSDPLIRISELKAGDRFLDCTLGLAADSLVASFILGASGEVVGLEGSFPLYLLVKEGLKTYEDDQEEITSAMRRIHVYHTDHLSFLKSQPTKSFDIIYFDPMFYEPLEASKTIRSMDELMDHKDLSFEAIQEAKRVGKRRIILKDHFRSPRFERFGFHQEVRLSSKTHYGYINI